MALNRKQLQSKLSTVTSELLKEKGYISFVDVFMKLGYLDPKDYENWRMKRVPYLERVSNYDLHALLTATLVRYGISGKACSENVISYIEGHGELPKNQQYVTGTWNLSRTFSALQCQVTITEELETEKFQSKLAAIAKECR